MRSLVFAFTLAFAVAAEKPVGPVSSEDELLVVTAEVAAGKERAAKLLGQDPGMELIVVDVKVAPRGDTKVAVSLDDFTLISRKDGQRSQPLAPSQIAGRDALVVAQGGRGGGGIGTMNPRGPIWGGVPGTSSRPQRLGGDDAITTGGTTETKATVTTGAASKDNPLLALLKEKALPQRETNEPMTGLLYFFLDGKHKRKDLELMYKSPAGRLILDFEK